PAVTLTGCCFVTVPDPEGWTATVRGGQYAVTVAGSAAVSLSQCAFGPHAAAVAFLGDDVNRAQARVAMTNCTALLAGDAAGCRLDRTFNCSLAAKHCLFARPEAELEEAGGSAVLIRQAPGQEGLENFTYLGEDNAYHNLAARGGLDPAGRNLTESPWEES